MTDLCRFLEIDKILTTNYRPQTNACAERFHKSLNSIISKSVAENQRNWDTVLPMALAAYRASVHSSTSFSPNRLILGREVRAPLDVVLGLPLSERQIPSDYVAFVADREEDMRYAYGLVRKQLRKCSQRRKSYYDARLKHTEFSLGDWVYYYYPRVTKARSRKWAAIYQGPMLVIEKRGPVTFIIQKSAKSRPITAHVDKLKHCRGPVPTPWVTFTPITTNSSTSTQYIQTTKFKHATFYSYRKSLICICPVVYLRNNNNITPSA